MSCQRHLYPLRRKVKPTNKVTPLFLSLTYLDLYISMLPMTIHTTPGVCPIIPTENKLHCLHFLVQLQKKKKSSREEEEEEEGCELMIMSKVKYSLIILISFVGVWGEVCEGKGVLLNDSRLEMFVDELPILPKLYGYRVDYDQRRRLLRPNSLVIGMFRKTWKFHRDLPPTPVFAYGVSEEKATVPGPTIEARHGVPTYVTWENHLPSKHILPWDPTIPTAVPAIGRGVPTVVHLHGGITEPSSDGHAGAWFTAGFEDKGPTWTHQTYRYHNQQHPGTLWYHDHAMGLTRVNLLAGLIGSYIVRHPEVEAPLRLPAGEEFDRTLVVFDRSFRSDGSIYMNSTGNNPSIHPQWQPEYFGDAIIVNGKVWPKMIARRRKYRFRIINASNARFFRFFFTNGLRFTYVASDSSYLDKPVTTGAVFLAPSEIANVVVDFSESKDDHVILANDAPYPYPSGDPANEFNGMVMKVFINRRSESEKWRIPATLIKYPSPDLASATRTRYIALYEYTSKTDEPTHLFINGVPFEAPATEKPRVGTTEIWNVINLTEDNHPLHIHIGLVKAMEQRELVKVEEFKQCMLKKNDAVKCKIKKYVGRRSVAVAAQEKGWKNVFKMMPGHVTKLAVRFAPIDSDNASYPFDATAEPGYAYHCHILDHEDNVMMRPLKLVE